MGLVQNISASYMGLLPAANLLDQDPISSTCNAAKYTIGLQIRIAPRDNYTGKGQMTGEYRNRFSVCCVDLYLLYRWFRLRSSPVKGEQMA